MPSLGKVPRSLLEGAVFSNLGASSRSVMVKPGHGLDNGIVRLDGGKVLVVTADPLSIIPSLGMRRSAWLSVHLLASDLATSGASPQFAAFDLNLPPEIGDADLAAYLGRLGRECRDLGVAIIGGHTGRYPGCGYTIAGGGFMFAVVDQEAYVTPGMARKGDRVIVTKGAAVGTTGILANAFPRRLGKKIGERLLSKARRYLSLCSVVTDASAAASVGLRKGVTSMHDATEGGVLGGLSELSGACGRRVEVDLDRIRVSEETAAVCDVFGMDPLVCESEGTLIITCRPEAAEEVGAALGRAGLHHAPVGEVVDGPAGLLVKSSATGGSKGRLFEPPASDPYWKAYATAVAERWD